MKKGMIKVSVFYPNGSGKKFDMDYYIHKHIPLVLKAMGDSIKFYSIDKGLAGGTPASAATFTSIGNLYFESIESFQQAFGPQAGKIMGDIPNFTNIEPVVQISEVVM